MRNIGVEAITLHSLDYAAEMAEVQANALSMIVEDRMAVFQVGKVPQVESGDIIQLVHGTLG